MESGIHECVRCAGPGTSDPIDRIDGLKSASSPQELRSYAELRTAIEVQASRQAAELATEDDIVELAALLKQLDDENLPYPEALEVDFCFHQATRKSP